MDRLQIYTNDGSPLAPGKAVTLATTVYAWSGYTSDHLDLYLDLQVLRMPNVFFGSPMVAWSLTRRR